MSQDNININIEETNDIVNIVSSEVTEVIDINVGETVEEVTLNITEEIIQVNINKVTGGGDQTLAQTLVFGNQTDGTDIFLNNEDSLLLENTSSLKKGTYNFGGNGGISRVCSNNYEDMWQNGFRHVFDQSGFIRNSTNCFNIVPDVSFDVTLRFKIGSIWTLDDGTNYICTDATEGAAVWELYNVIPTNTSDLNNDSNFVSDASYVHTDNNFTTAEQTKLAGIEAGAEVNVNADWNATSGDAQILNKPTIPSAGVTSVGLTMPTAFSVTNSPITSSGDIAVTGAGLVSQYVRGDGTLANFPNSTGGGSSVNYYLNGSVSQGTFGGATYYQMSKTPILGAGTNFIRTNGAGNGYIASFITDAGDPSFLNIPGGNWNVEFYFQSSATGGSPQFYGEIYKVSATNVFTLVASGSANPESITNGTTVDQYFTSIPMPQTSLLITDRLAIRIYVITGGRTITLHTENGNLCEVLTTFTTGLTALNGLTSQVQNLTVGTSGTDFAISSVTDTHTFNLPTASATNRGALSTTDWSAFNGKFNLPSLTSGSVLFSNGTTIAQDNANFFWDDTNNRLGIGTNAPANTLHIPSFNTTNSQARIGSLEMQSYSLNNSWFADNMFFNGTGFQHRNTGKAVLFYFFGGEGQFRSFASAAAGTVRTAVNNAKLKFDELGNFGIGANILETPGTFTGSFLRVFSTGNVTINQAATDAGFRLDVNGTTRLNGNTSIGGAAAGARLDVRAQGALSTDIAFRVRNSADSANLFDVNGAGGVSINSTTQGFLPPRMTTTQKNAIASPAEGLIVYDSTLGKLCVRTAAAWETITSL